MRTVWAVILPLTSNSYRGLVVPIPTLPLAIIYMWSVTVPAVIVANTKPAPTPWTRYPPIAPPYPFVAPAEFARSSLIYVVLLTPVPAIALAE